MATKLQIQRKRFIDGVKAELLDDKVNDPKYRKLVDFLDNDWRDDSNIRRFEQGEAGNTSRLDGEQKAFFEGVTELYKAYNRSSINSISRMLSLEVPFFEVLNTVDNFRHGAHKSILEAAEFSLSAMHPDQYMAFLGKVVPTGVRSVIYNIRRYSSIDELTDALQLPSEHVSRPSNFDSLYDAACTAFQGPGMYKYASAKIVAGELGVSINEVTEFPSSRYRMKIDDMERLFEENGILIDYRGLYRATPVLKIVAKGTENPTIYTVEPDQLFQGVQIMGDCIIVSEGESEKLPGAFRDSVYTDFVRSVTANTPRGEGNLYDDLHAIHINHYGIKGEERNLLTAPEDQQDLSLLNKLKIDSAFREHTGLSREQILQPVMEPVKF